MAEPQTLPQHLLTNRVRHAQSPAIREKDRGIWQSWTWAAYGEVIEEFALGLTALGFQRGEKLAVIGDNRPHLYAAQLAAQCMGGISVAVYQDAIAEELGYTLAHSEAVIIVAEDQEQVDKVLAIKTQLPKLRYLVFNDARGMRHYKMPWLLSFADIQIKGRAKAAERPNYFETEIAQGRAEDVALFCYTSGTTGKPKGVMLTHANIIQTTKIFCQVEDVRRTDNWLSYLPMAWVGDTVYGFVLSIITGAACNCPESPETVQRDLRELGPSGIVAAPRIWENMLSMVQVKAQDASPLKRWIFNQFFTLADTMEILKSEGKQTSAWQNLLYRIGDMLVYRPVRDQLGLERVRWAYTGGAPLGPDTFRFFRGFGINLKQIYGATELSGLATNQPLHEANPDTVGRPCPGIDVRIAANNEILVHSPGVFAGYYKNADATRSAIDDQGFFHTGDAGLIDERGHLVVVDRAKDVGRMEDGTAFAPQFVENKLKYSPFVGEAVSFGDGQPFVTAMIAIDFANVSNWADRRGLPYTNYQDLSQKQEVKDLIAQELVACNRRLPAATQIRRFLLLVKDLEADDNEVTRTRKLRRRFIAEKYAAVIEAFYSNRRQVAIATEITFEDGRRSLLHFDLAIHDVVLSRQEKAGTNAA